MNNKTILWIGIGVVIVVALIVLLSTSPTQAPPQSEDPSQTETGAPTDTFTPLSEDTENLEFSQPDILLPAPPDEEGVFDIPVYQIAIIDGSPSPQHLVLEQGEPAQIEVSVEGSDYDLEIADLNIYIPLLAGNATAFDLDTSVEKGTYLMTCQSCEDAGSLSITIK